MLGKKEDVTMRTLHHNIFLIKKLCIHFKKLLKKLGAILHLIFAQDSLTESWVLTVTLPSSGCSWGTAESKESPRLAQYLLENIIIAGCIVPV